jgi:hypothetical protein
MRNPKDSWDRADTEFYSNTLGIHADIGPNDLALANTLAKGGPVHAKFRRMITVYLDITAPLYWWKEFDTYKVGTNCNSCSTMHTIHKRDLTFDDFACEHLSQTNRNLLETIIRNINAARHDFIEAEDSGSAKEAWWQMIQLLPTSFLQRRTIELNYEVLVGIYRWRKNHKQDEWRQFCAWIETLPYAKELIINESN